MTKHSHTYEQIAHFIAHEMRMSHIYQPVMLREILRHKGTASVTNVAKALLAEDRSQLEYYEQITKTMVGRVLTNNRGITEKDGETYHLKNFSNLSKPKSMSWSNSAMQRSPNILRSEATLGHIVESQSAMYQAR